MVAYAFCTLNKQWFLAPNPLTLILAFHYRTLIAAWQSSNVSDERNFFPDTSPHDKLTDEVISCKQKAAKSSVAVPIFSSTSGFRVVVCCACKHLHWRLAWFFLADRDNSRDFCFTAEHYGDIICHSLIRWWFSHLMNPQEIFSLLKLVRFLRLASVGSGLHLQGL